MPISSPVSWQIEHRKVVDYLLNPVHKDGQAKARKFLQYGFLRSAPDRLVLALMDHASATPTRVVEGHHGTTFVFEGPLPTPIGVIPRIRSIWLMGPGESSARLVTAYPFDERRRSKP